MCHREGKRGKVAGRGKESPEGKGLITFYLMTATIGSGCVRCAHIFLCFRAFIPKGRHLIAPTRATHYVNVPHRPIWPLALTLLPFLLSRACQHSTPDSGQPLALPQLTLATPWHSAQGLSNVLNINGCAPALRCAHSLIPRLHDSRLPTRQHTVVL